MFDIELTVYMARSGVMWNVKEYSENDIDE